MKGYLPSTVTRQKHHKLKKLVANFECTYPSCNLVKTLDPFIRNIDVSSPLGQFLLDNKIQIDDWYQALKYPASTAGKKYSHIELKYGGSSKLNFWKRLKNDSKKIQK